MTPAYAQHLVQMVRAHCRLEGSYTSPRASILRGNLVYFLSLDKAAVCLTVFSTYDARHLTNLHQQVASLVDLGLHGGARRFVQKRLGPLV
jgi:hypothetical protein